MVNSVESLLTSPLVEDCRLGAAFGILNGINGAPDLVSSIVAGALWTLVSLVAALGLGAWFNSVAGAALWVRPPKPV